MDNTLFRQYAVADRSYVAFIKRTIHNLVRPEFNEVRTGEIDIVVSELTSNLIKHAQKGELLYRLSREDEQPLFELICIDNGSGINDLQHSMKDGISSKNTLGHGLGSITRLSNLAQFYSIPQWGTIVYCRFYPDLQTHERKESLTVRCLNVAKPGEEVSGDGIALRKLKSKMLVLAADGLGHGIHAKLAVDTAKEIFAATNQSDPSEILRELNAGVKKTRGLVATVAVIDQNLKKGKVCGIGNIHTRILKGIESKNYIGNNGIVGLNIPTRIESAMFDVEKLQQLVFCSDGIRTKWDLALYPGILRYDPMIAATAIYKDHARQNDDMTILIVKIS